MIQQIVTKLFDLMAKNFRNFPSDYLSFDVETTGTRFHKEERGSAYNGDLITELGFCHVRDGKATDYAGLTLDWTRVKAVNQDWLKNRLETTKKYVETHKNGTPTGKSYHMTYEIMANNGGDPFDILRNFADLFRDTRAHKNFFVAHNGYHFDVRYLQDLFKHCLGDDFRFNDDELVDTGMIIKAAKAGTLPWDGDTIRDWSLRVYRLNLKGIHWTLDKDCVPVFEIDTKYNLDVSKAHSAGFDAYATHLLLEELKDIAAGKRIDPFIPVSV